MTVLQHYLSGVHVQFRRGPIYRVEDAGSFSVTLKVHGAITLHCTSIDRRGRYVGGKNSVRWKMKKVWMKYHFLHVIEWLYMYKHVQMIIWTDLNRYATVSGHLQNTVTLKAKLTQLYSIPPTSMTYIVQEYPGAPWDATVYEPFSSNVYRKLLFFTILPLLKDLAPWITFKGSYRKQAHIICCKLLQD